MTPWKEMIFDDFARLKRGFDLPNPLIEPGPYPVVASTSIKAHHKVFKAKGPGVVTGRSGSLGTVQFVPNDFWPLNTTLFVKDFKGNDPRFVAYFLELMHLESFDSGAGVPTLNQNHLHRLGISVPDELTQRKIAAVLSAYDELINNTRQRVATIERMAEQIFREWFVRFRFPGYEKARFEKGQPASWKLKTLRQVTKFYIGGGWGEDVQSASYTEGAFVIRGTDIPHLNNGNLSREIHRYHTLSSLKSRRLRAGDFVFEVSGGSKNQLLGRNLLITDKLLRFFDDNAICASFCKLIRFSDEVSPSFMKYFLKLYYETGLVGLYQVQSTGISNYQFESFLSHQTILVPPAELIQMFDSSVSPLLELRDELSLSNRKLIDTRNLLIPRLISGKLRVDDLDIQFPYCMQAVA